MARVVLPDASGADDGGGGGAGLGTCALCGREMPVSLHHLIPLTQHAKLKKKGRTYAAEFERTIGLCRPCHSAVHKAEADAVLAESYSSLEALQGHPEIARFAEWAAKEKVTGGAVGGAGYRQ